MGFWKPGFPSPGALAFLVCVSLSVYRHTGLPCFRGGEVLGGKEASSKKLRGTEGDRERDEQEEEEEGVMCS